MGLDENYVTLLPDLNGVCALHTVIDDTALSNTTDLFREGKVISFQSVSILPHRAS